MGSLKVEEECEGSGDCQQDLLNRECEYSNMAALPEIKYEYLDHPADVQLHAFGDNLKEAFEQCAICMFGYMTSIETVEPVDTKEMECEGSDLLSLLFQFLDELLYNFSAEDFFIPRRVEITEFNLDNFSIKAVCQGEPFDLQKHPQGTEVKAITYSAMQVHTPEESEDGLAHVFVVVDI